ncbi:transmembrane protein 11, mitochondrial-like [Mytilus californianus]|uniref:transmembrane protein 11, mitochondrial-like n=1 Tax=Mytilus californianus TaxID=6549 RepID=UPI002244FE49|nr:transmembrane protein 11, mitochondrial-like [Mytilus californianus]
MAEFSNQTPPKYITIKDRSEDQQEETEQELQTALESKAKYIIIEPHLVGELTVRWIKVGNFFHKVSVVSGVIALAVMYTKSDKLFIYLPLATTSILSAGLYALSSNDPCCKYQIEISMKNIEKLPLHNLSSSSPVILVRRDDTRRKWLQNIVAVTSGGLSLWRLYHWFYNL